VQASVSVPYPKEFRTVRDNRALLEQIADRTGGRVLSMGNPVAVDAFLREGLPIPESARRMWDLMAILAAVLFLLDVAVRRIAIDWGGAREALAGRVTTREAGEGTVAAWKKARQQSDSRRASPTSSAPQTSDALRETLEKGPALDVRAEMREGGSTQPARGASSASNTPSGDVPAKGADQAEQDTTSRLLRAKRRATGGADDAGGESGGGSTGGSGGSGGPRG
jgi:hypothetical protein